MMLTEKQVARRVVVGKLYQKVWKPVCLMAGVGAMILTDHALGTLMNIYVYGNPDGYKTRTYENGVRIDTF